MNQQQRWEEYLRLVEFGYNNGYQQSLRMSLFEALYRHTCNTPISWSDPVNRVLIGLDMLEEMEHEMQVIKKNMNTAWDIQKICADRKRLLKEFQVGD